MANGIKANIKGMVMGFKEAEFVGQDSKIDKYIKVKLHDKVSKQDMECRFTGTVEEFLNLGIQEYETYNVELEFSGYKLEGRTVFGCKVSDIKPLNLK